MRPRVWIVSLTLIVSLAGCRLPAEDEPFTPAPVPVPSSTQTLPPVATPTKLPTLTPRPPNLYVMARELPVNCRFGPGTIYEIIDGLQPFQSALVAGKDNTGLWWYVHNPNNPGAHVLGGGQRHRFRGGYGIPASGGSARGNGRQAGGAGGAAASHCRMRGLPQYVLLVAEISTNGPALVTWRWEMSTGEVTEAGTLIFEEADTQVVQKSVVVYSPNDYWGQLHVDAPNEIITQVKFIANCTQ